MYRILTPEHVEKFAYHPDPLRNDLMALENRVAVLEGKPPPHEKICLECHGEKRIFCFMGPQSWYEDCPCCQGNGSEPVLETSGSLGQAIDTLFKERTSHGT